VTQLLQPAPGNGGGPPVDTANLERLIRSSFLLGWRELHLEPRTDGLHIRVRGPEGLSGLQKMNAAAAEDLWQQLQQRIGPSLDNDSGRLASVKFTLLDGEPVIQADAVIVRTVRGLAATLTLNPASRNPLPLREYGMDPERAGQLEDLFRGTGIAALCAKDISHALGPIYSLLTGTAWEAAKVVSLEREPFHDAQHVVQIAHGGAPAALAALLPAALALKPDVLLVEGITTLDDQTAAWLLLEAGAACLTALVVPAGGIIGGLSYLLHLPRGKFIVETNLRGLASFQIFPRLCRHCRAPVYLEASAGDSELPESETPRGYRPVGCSECSQTGFAGRKTIVELLFIGEFVRNSLLRGEPVDKLAALLEGSGALDGPAQCQQAIRNGEISIGVAAGADGRYSF